MDSDPLLKTKNNKVKQIEFIYFTKLFKLWYELYSNGIGILDEDREFIFERFYRTNKSREKETGGIGIGLTISKSIVNAHNGEIFVNSKLNEGTEFIIKLPKL